MSEINYAGPSKEMVDALEAEGLNVSWPKEVTGEEDLAIEGSYHTGKEEYEKLVLIDLRGDKCLETEEDVDREIASELRDASDNYIIDEEVKAAIGTRGAPGVAALVWDCEEAEGLLERFADVAEAVANGRPVPPKEIKAEGGETVHITPAMADDIVAYLKMSYKSMNGLGKSDVSFICNSLLKKIGKPPVEKWD